MKERSIMEDKINIEKSSFLQETIKKKEYQMGKVIIKITGICILGVCIGMLLSVVLHMLLSLRNESTSVIMPTTVQETIVVDRESMTMESLGVILSDVEESIRHEYELPQGLYVHEVMLGTSMFEMGIKPGDIITALEGEVIHSMEEFSQLLFLYEGQNHCVLEVKRKGLNTYETINFKLNLEQ